MVPHPCRSGIAIEVMGDGHVREVRVSDGRVVKTYSASLQQGFSKNRTTEIVAVRGDDSGFFLFLRVSGCFIQWNVFSSAADKWTEKDWPNDEDETRTAFYDDATQSIYFHIQDNSHWYAISFAQPQDVREGCSPQKKKRCLGQGGDACQLCHDSNQETASLDCGHRYCGECAKLLEAFGAVRLMGRGMFEEGWIKAETVCLVCAGKGAGVEAGQAERCLAVVRRAQEADWEGALGAVAARVASWERETLARVKREAEAALRTVREAEDRAAAIRKKKVSAAALLRDVLEAAGRGGEERGRLMQRVWEAGLLMASHGVEVEIKGEGTHVMSWLLDAHRKTVVSEESVLAGDFDVVPTTGKALLADYFCDPVRGIRPGAEWGADKNAMILDVTGRYSEDNDYMVEFDGERKVCVLRQNLNPFWELDLDTMEARMLPKFGWGVWYEYSQGGNVYGRDEYGNATVCEGSSESWRQLGFKCEHYDRLLAHPWNREFLLHVSRMGTVIERRVSDGAAVKVHACEKQFEKYFESMFSYCGAHGEYFLLGMDVETQYSAAFSSASGEWTDVPWRLGSDLRMKSRSNTKVVRNSSRASSGTMSHRRKPDVYLRPSKDRELRKKAGRRSSCSLSRQTFFAPDF